MGYDNMYNLYAMTICLIWQAYLQHNFSEACPVRKNMIIVYKHAKLNKI